MLDTLRDWHVDRSALSRVLIGVLLLVGMVTAPAVYGIATSGDRIDESLANAQGPQNVQVMLSFSPGAYHQRELAEHGVFGGIRDESVVLFNVSPDGLKNLGNIYWIDEIIPFQRD